MDIARGTLYCNGLPQSQMAPEPVYTKNEITSCPLSAEVFPPNSTVTQSQYVLNGRTVLQFSFYLSTQRPIG